MTTAADREGLAADPVEAGCRAVYGKNWDGPEDKRPGLAMQKVWRDLVAKAQSPLADSAAQAVAERDEADRRAGAAERLLDDERDTTRKRNRWLREAKERAGYHDDISFDTVWAETLAKAERAQRLEAALILLLPFVDFAAGEGQEFTPDPDDAAQDMDAAALCEAAAKALGYDLGCPDYMALLTAGHEAIRALAGQDKTEGGQP